jgi:hypothetical protein
MRLYPQAMLENRNLICETSYGTLESVISINVSPLDSENRFLNKIFYYFYCVEMNIFDLDNMNMKVILFEGLKS